MDTQAIPSEQAPEASESLKLSELIFYTIEPYLTGRILEMHTGSGPIADVFIKHSIPLHINAPDKINWLQLYNKYNSGEAIRHIHNINFLADDFAEAYQSIFQTFNTILAVNLIDNISYEKLALINAKHLLRATNHLIIATPPFTTLYEGLDISPEEWQRYNWNALRHYLPDYEIMRLKYISFRDSDEWQKYKHIGYLTIVIAKVKR